MCIIDIKGVILIACPICKSGQFYIKDPSDPYEIYEFQLQNGVIQFDDPDSEADLSLAGGEREIFCQRCSWHGKYDSIE